mgnify:CR=1 FL=1
MKTYIKFLINIYLKSFFYVFMIMLSLILILNILSEIEFFKNYEVNSYLPIYLSLLNSPDLIFEMYPFIFLLTTQVFFINLFSDNQIQIFKYSSLKNSKILWIISLISLTLGILIITGFYSLSSNLKNVYLELKNKYNSDNKHLAVITKNGLWIKDIVGDEVRIVSAYQIDKNYLVNVFISEFDKEFNLKRNISSEKIDIASNEWVIFKPTVYENNISKRFELIKIDSNFNYQRIQSLFSNLSSLSLLELIDLRKNYEKINYSTIEVDIQLQKLMSFPIYFTLMTILSSIIMFNTKKFKSSTLKISIGLFCCVVIYYINNFFYVLGDTERIPLSVSVWLPLVFLILINTNMMLRINEK